MYWQTSEFEISGYDKCKTWFVDTRLQKKNVKLCYCVCFRSGYKVQSGLIQIQFNPLTLPDTIYYLLLKKEMSRKTSDFLLSI